MRDSWKAVSRPKPVLASEVSTHITHLSPFIFPNTWRKYKYICHKKQHIFGVCHLVKLKSARRATSGSSKHMPSFHTIGSDLYNRGVPAYTQSTQLRTLIFECLKNENVLNHEKCNKIMPHPGLVFKYRFCNNHEPNQ